MNDDDSISSFSSNIQNRILYINWTELCGKNESVIWNNNTWNFDICFQKYGLFTIIFSLFATVSAFYIGNKNNNVIRERKHLMIIYFRITIVSLMLLLSVLEPIIVYTIGKKMFSLSDIIQTCVQVSIFYIFISLLINSISS